MRNLSVLGVFKEGFPLSEHLLDNILEKETTRRDFLKTAAKGTAALALGASLLSLVGCSSPMEQKGELTGLPLPQGMLVVTPDLCIGCGRCELACSMATAQQVQPALSAVHSGSGLQFGQSGPRLNYRYGDGLMGTGKLEPVVCRQCRAPMCANVCPNQAILPDKKTGARTVDPEKCDGCGRCISACPWQAIAQNPETGIAIKCITCGSCVEACPTGALAIAEWTDL